MSVELQKSFENLQKEFEEYKKNHGTNAMSELIKKELTGITEAIKKADENKEKISELESAIKKADELIKAVQLSGTIKKAGEQFTKEEIAGALGEAFSALEKSGEKSKYTIEDVLNKIEKSDNNIVKAMTTETGNNASTVKPFFVERILEKVLESNTVAKYIPYLTITDGSIWVPKEESEFFEAGWVGELGNRTETSGLVTSTVKIELFQIYAMPVISNKLLGTNFVQIGNFIMMKIAQGISQKISDSVWYGAGTDQPTGIFENADVQANFVPVTTANFNFDVFLQATYSLKEDFESEARWFMNKKTWSELLGLKDNQGRYLVDITSAINKTEKTMWGFPVEFNSSLPVYSDITVDETPFAFFGNIARMMMGAKNNNLTISIKDQITQKGVTKLYTEMGLGHEVVDHNAGTGLIYKA